MQCARLCTNMELMNHNHTHSKLMKNPSLVVISGPSGAGKSTLLQRLFSEFKDRFAFSVSCKLNLILSFCLQPFILSLDDGNAAIIISKTNCDELKTFCGQHNIVVTDIVAHLCNKIEKMELNFTAERKMY